MLEVASHEAHSLNGGPFGSELVRADYRTEGVPVIRGVNLAADTGFSFDDLVFVSEEKAWALRANTARPGDLVFTQRGTLGQVGLIPLTSPYDLYVISQSQMKLTIDESVADSTFIYYYFRDAGTVRRISDLASSSGVPHINLETFRQFEICLPPLDVQRRVASTLRVFDALIANNSRRMELLEETVRLLFRDWFVNGNWRIAGSPTSGNTVRLKDLARERRVTVEPSSVDPRTPYVGLEHLPRRSLAMTEWGEAADVQSTKLRFHRGDVLFGKIRPYFHKVAIAPVDGVCSTDAIVIEPLDPKLRSTVIAMVSSDEFVAAAVQTSNGTKMPRANWKVLLETVVTLPPPVVLDAFLDVADKVHRDILAVSLASRALRQMRAILLPRLVSRGMPGLTPLASDS